MILGPGLRAGARLGSAKTNGFPVLTTVPAQNTATTAVDTVGVH